MNNNYEIRLELLNLFLNQKFDISLSNKSILGYSNPKYTNDKIYSNFEFLANSKLLEHSPINYENMVCSVHGLTYDGEHYLDFLEEKRKSETFCGKFLKTLPIIDFLLAVIAILIASLVGK